MVVARHQSDRQPGAANDQRQSPPTSYGRNQMRIATIVLSALLAATFLGSGAVKLVGAKPSLQIRDRLGVGEQLWRVIGALEIAAAGGLLVGLTVPVLGIAAATGLSLLLIGSIAVHARAHDLRNASPAVVLLGVAVAAALVRFLSM
jgi:DoxX-like family